MRSLLLASSALILAATGAQAQDAGYDWSGFYIGVQGGYGWSDVDVEYAEEDEEDVSSDDGLIGGLHVGYDWQEQSFVFGVIGDLDFVGHDVDEDLSGKLENYTYDVDWVATGRARAGLAMDRTLFFGSGGLALAGIDVSAEIDNIPVNDRGEWSGVKVGGVVGVGIEHAFTSNWSAKAEYVHHIFDEVDLDVEGDSVVFDPSFGALKFGISYRF